jgi:hypothetical protein
MSELGVLSHRYDRSAHFTEELNESVLIIKMSYYRIEGKEKISKEQLENSQKILIEIITEIADNLDPKKMETPLEKHFISRNLLKTLYTNKRGKLRFYLEDLRTLAEHLNDLSKITEEDIGILDELCAIGDNESS